MATVNNLNFSYLTEIKINSGYQLSGIENRNLFQKKSENAFKIKKDK